MQRTTMNESLPLCFLLCFSRSCNCRQRWLHIVQLNGCKIAQIKNCTLFVSKSPLTLSSLCILMWTLKFPPWLNPLWQILHRCVKICEWVFMWRDNLMDVGKALPHVEHVLPSVLLSFSEEFWGMWLIKMSSGGLPSFSIVKSLVVIRLISLAIGWRGTVETAGKIINSFDRRWIRQ